VASSSVRPSTAAKLIDEATVRSLAAGSTLVVPPGALITPLARQIALERRITLQGGPGGGSVGATGSAPQVVGSKVLPQQRVAIGADHGGYTMKEALKPHLQALGYEVVDCGTHSTDAVDYPDIAYAVARLVADGQCANGIIVDGAGIGSCMAANKVPGVRAAMCYDHATAVNSREHNHANVLTLGAGLIGVNLAKQIVSDWLATPFGPGRHAKRVEKIMAIEKRYFK
jgi:ribose 5-phosphate isomerase B